MANPQAPIDPREALIRAVHASWNGRYERFKTTRDYDANEGRVAHHHPLIGAAD